MYYGYTIRGGPGDLEPGGGAGRRAPGSVRRAAAHRSLLTDLNRDHGLVGRHPLRDQTARRAGVAEGDALEAALLAQQLVEILGAGRRRVASYSARSAITPWAPSSSASPAEPRGYRQSGYRIMVADRLATLT